MKNILIIGGCGYIGSILYDFLSTVYKVDTLDLEWFGNYNPKNIKKDFDELTVEELDMYDVVIHVAANSSVPLCKDVFDSFDNNVTKFINLVKKLKKQKFIYASSSCVYVSGGNPKVETDTLYPMDGLTLTKTTIDQFMPLTDVEYYGLRFGSVNGYSPNMRLDLMVNAMTLSAINNKCVNVFNGQASRPILGMLDLIRSIGTIINSDVDNRGIYNIASENYTIYEVGKKVSDYFNVPLIDNGKNYTYDFTIDTSKFRNVYNFEFMESIESIIETITGHEINPNWQKRETK